MDRGLAAAVERFADAVGGALIIAATGTSVPSRQLRRDAVLEAFLLTCAVIDVDRAHSDEELWALTATFGRYDMVPAAALPRDLRVAGVIEGKASWLLAPSAMFTMLADLDRRRPGTLARTYADEAIRLAHVVTALDPYATSAKVGAVADYGRRLRGELPPAAEGRSDDLGGQSFDPGGRRVDGSAATGATDAVTEAEVDAATIELPPAEPVEEVLAELDALIGLDAVKEQVRLLTAMLRVQALRAERGFATVERNRHLVFSGNPGTGKTTVARLLARLYRSLGILERGHLTEVDRSGLVAGFVGQTATKVAGVFDAADGGVLLIDEAYSLIRGGEKDFGREAIDAIVKQVEDRRDSLIVILAGYPAEMAELVGANPGFSSRFPTTIHFPDYDDGELVAILELLASSAEYDLDDETRTRAEVWFAEQERGVGFGNGRLARNLFEQAVARHATRVTEIAEPTDADLRTLTPEDLPGGRPTLESGSSDLADDTGSAPGASTPP